MMLQPQQVWLAIQPVDMWPEASPWLGARRLHRGRFIWPHTSDVICTLNQEQWTWLITGVDWQKLSAQPLSHWRV